MVRKVINVKNTMIVLLTSLLWIGGIYLHFYNKKQIKPKYTCKPHDKFENIISVINTEDI